MLPNYILKMNCLVLLLNFRFMISETVGISAKDRLRYYEAGSMPFFFDLIPISRDSCKQLSDCFLKTIDLGLNTSGGWPNFVVSHDNDAPNNEVWFNLESLFRAIITIEKWDFSICMLSPELIKQIYKHLVVLYICVSLRLLNIPWQWFC